MIDNNSIDIKLILFFILALITLLGSFRIIYNYILPAIADKKKRNFFERWVLRSQLFFWILFFLFFAYRFVESAPFFSLIVLILLLVLGWKFWQDLFGGIQIRLHEKIKPGVILKVEDIKGKVASLGLRNLELSTQQGRKTTIPFRMISSESFTICLSSEKDLEVKLLLSKSGLANLGGFKEVEKLLLASPWASPVYSPSLTYLDDDQVEIKAWAVNTEDKGNYEKYLDELFHSRKS